MVPVAGLEPARLFTVSGFSSHYNFRYLILVCVLDFLLTISRIIILGLRFVP